MYTVKFCGKKLWGIWLFTDILRWTRQNRRDTQIISEPILWMRGRKWQNSIPPTFPLYGIDGLHRKADAPPVLAIPSDCLKIVEPLSQTSSKLPHISHSANPGLPRRFSRENKCKMMRRLKGFQPQNNGSLP